MSQLLSILVPVYNEEKNIIPLIEKIKEVMKGGISFEILFIDDGSQDGTLGMIKEARKSAKNIYFLSFSRNFGHQNALKAGFDNCRGDAVISLDGDGQHPPELIPKMLRLWEKGAQIVYTERKDSKDTGFFKKWMSSLFYRLMSFVSDIDFQSGTADFRLLDRQVVEALRKFSEKDLFYRGIVSWAGFHKVKLVYRAEERLYGVSKYSLKKMCHLALNGITGFSVFPLRIAAITGFGFAGLSFLYGIYAIFVHFFTGQAVSGWASTMAGIYFLGGIQLITLGLIGEYVGKIFMEVKKRPHYLTVEAVLPVDTYSETENNYD